MVKNTTMALFSAAKEQSIEAKSLRLRLAYLRGRYNGGARLQNSNRRNDVRHYR